ncbi:MAG TPA: hydrogenase expression/formation protein HypE [Firmicutes bacterium]|nr:hydrogenase expression/formation protein HypE [Bacillota bacterium]
MQGQEILQEQEILQGNNQGILQDDNQKNNVVTLAHGGGGELTNTLVTKVFQSYFHSPYLDTLDDAARLNINMEPADTYLLPPERPGQGATAAPGRLQIAITTDSFVVRPIFFSGGDIGRLAVCGTINDLSVAGARPLALTCSVILEEGFAMDDLRRIVASMAQATRECGVPIVTGDTKVVERGACDGIYINTTGIGAVRRHIYVSGANARPGDRILITGTIGDHEASIQVARLGSGFESDLASDVAPLWPLVSQVLDSPFGCDIHAMRDPTRGGVAAALNEIALESEIEVFINESELPVKPQVNAICELLGLDPLYLANEGKILMFVSPESSHRVLEIIRSHPMGREARVIGEVARERRSRGAPGGRVWLRTILGGVRELPMPIGLSLPRIC